MLHMVGQARYEAGVLHSVVGIDPVCIGGSICNGGLGKNPDCSEMKQLGQDEAGEARKAVP